MQINPVREDRRVQGPSKPARAVCWFSICVILLAASTVPARAAREFEKVGTIGAQFLKIPIGARAAAIGCAFTAIADDATAVFWNPAGIARIEEKTLSFNYAPWLASTQLSEAAYVTRFRFLPGSVAFDVRSLAMPDDEVRTVFRPDGTGTRFDAGDVSVGIVYARSLTDKFSTGLGVNWVQSTLATYTAQALTFDFGTLYDTGFRSFRIGMAIQNIGGDMTYLNDPAKVPTVFRVGMSTLLLDNAAQSLQVAGEFSHPPDNSERANVGMEYALRRTVFLRGGWFFRFDTERFSAGAGVRLPGPFVKENRFDYAYTEMRGLSPIHRFGMEFRF